MKNLLFNLKSVQIISYKAEVGAGTGPKQIVSAPQHCQITSNARQNLPLYYRKEHELDTVHRINALTGNWN